MTEHDVLERAAKALRTANTGEHQGSGFTRARIMTSLHQSRRGRLYRWAIGAPLASVLLVGSAWAQSTGKWPVVWAAVAGVFTAEQKPTEPTGSVRTNEPRAPQRSAPLPAVNEPEPAPPAEPAPSLVQDPVQETPVASERSTLRRPPPRASAPKASRGSSSKPIDTAPEKPAEPAAPPERPADPELARFRAAHELHFQGNQPERAIAAYEEYLSEFPRGRFVPEARYNMALDYIKLGDNDKARRALRPFADGAYGDYRKREAELLIEAMR
jgi:TolA-binding protein